MAARLAEIRPFLDERAWRLLRGAEARAIGYGGMKVVAAAAKAKADTVARGRTSWNPGWSRTGGCGRWGLGARPRRWPIRAWCRCWRNWSTRRPGGTRRRRCGGRRSRRFPVHALVEYDVTEARRLLADAPEHVSWTKGLLMNYWGLFGRVLLGSGAAVIV